MTQPNEAVSEAEVVDYGFQFVADLAAELSDGSIEIPAFPDNAIRITNALDDPDITADQAAKVIGADPVFSARLLRVANSVMVNGAGMEINDLRTAVARMGFKQAYNTVISVAIEQVMHKDVTEKLRPFLKELWHHSAQVAAYSYVIARKQTKINPDVALLAGLLHDIGKFYVLTRADKHPELFDHPEALNDICKQWHTGIGRSILEGWNFSEELALVADEHEVLDREICGGADLVDVVTVANMFTHQVESGEEFEPDWQQLHAIKRMKITADDVSQLAEEFDEEIQSMINALEG